MISLEFFLVLMAVILGSLAMVLGFTLPQAVLAGSLTALGVLIFLPEAKA